MAFYRILWRFNLEKNTVFCFQVQIGSLISGSLTDEELVKFRDQIHIEVNFDLFGLSIVSEEFDVITGGYK